MRSELPSIRTDLNIKAMREKASEWRDRNSALPKLIGIVLLGIWLMFGTICIIDFIGRNFL